jgi:hypothetical protein
LCVTGYILLQSGSTCWSSTTQRWERSFDVKRTDDLLANRVVFELSGINYTNNYYKLTKCLVQLIRIRDNV